MDLSEKDLNPGDHIYVRRRRFLYSHHGIYVGGGKVIHYSGAEKEKRDPVVGETAIKEFLKGGSLGRRDYKKRLPPSETLDLAKRHLFHRGYSLPFNNCEHFTTYCVTGKKKSKQVRNVIGSFTGIALAIVGGILLKRRDKKEIG